MVTMEGSFARKIAQLGETGKFWEKKQAALDETVLQPDTNLPPEVDAAQPDKQVADGVTETSIPPLILERDAFRDAYAGALEQLKVKDELIQDLQTQVLGLKSFVSSNSKMDEQVSDEAFAEKTQRLGNALQNWVITHFRRAKVDTTKADQKTSEELLLLVPTYETLAGASKIHLIQSLVSTVLVKEIFEAYFVGLPDDRARQLESTQSYMSQFESASQWRATTLGIIRKEAVSMLGPSTASIIDHTSTKINNILNVITDTKPSEARDQPLRALITDSIDLSRLLKVQKAVFTMQMPVIEAHQRTVFDHECMEDMGGEDEDSLESREIRCVTFPGIIKVGDENGESQHLRNVVAKIRVLCAPD